MTKIWNNEFLNLGLDMQMEYWYLFGICYIKKSLRRPSLVGDLFEVSSNISNHSLWSMNIHTKSDDNLSGIVMIFYFNP